MGQKSHSGSVINDDLVRRHVREALLAFLSGDTALRDYAEYLREGGNILGISKFELR